MVGSAGMGMEAPLLDEEINEGAPKWVIQGYLTGRPEEVEQERVRCPALGTGDWLFGKRERVDAVLAIGDPAVIARLYREPAKYVDFPKLVHPRARVAQHDLEMGVGNLICSGVTVTPACPYRQPQHP